MKRLGHSFKGHCLDYVIPYLNESIVFRIVPGLDWDPHILFVSQKATKKKLMAERAHDHKRHKQNLVEDLDAELFRGRKNERGRGSLWETHQRRTSHAPRKIITVN